MIKKVQELKECYIQFTDEEMAELNIKPKQKFSVNVMSDDSIILKPFATIDINLSEFSRDVLEMLIQESVEKDVSVNEVIVEHLTNYLNQLDNRDDIV